jgi:hypothetical protein
VRRSSGTPASSARSAVSGVGAALAIAVIEQTLPDGPGRDKRATRIRSDDKSAAAAMNAAACARL